MADFLILDDENKKGNEVANLASEPSLWFIERINLFLFSFQKVKTKEKVIFYRLLSTMTNAWVSLIKAVWILEKQEKNPVFKMILQDFLENLKEWENLSRCMEKFPKAFDAAEVGIIKSWEKTWLLNKSLTDLADQIEKLDSISWKIVWALMYPAFVLLVVVGVVIIMMVKVVPGLLEIFTSKEELPATTQFLISISDFFVNHWFLMLLVIIVSFIGVFFWKRTESGLYIFDNMKIKIPMVWEIVQKMILSKFSRVFSWLIASWVSIVESLKISAEAVGNEVYKQRIILLSKDVSSGIKIWESIDSDNLFPDMMVQMIQVWEQTAKLDETIEKVADFYDEQVDNVISTLNKLLEPIILVVLSVLVWFIALAIMQPIMWLSETVSNL